MSPVHTITYMCVLTKYVQNLSKITTYNDILTKTHLLMYLAAEFLSLSTCPNALVSSSKTADLLSSSSSASIPPSSCPLCSHRVTILMSSDRINANVSSIFLRRCWSWFFYLFEQTKSGTLEVRMAC